MPSPYVLVLLCTAGLAGAADRHHDHGHVYDAGPLSWLRKALTSRASSHDADHIISRQGLHSEADNIGVRLDRIQRAADEAMGHMLEAVGGDARGFEYGVGWGGPARDALRDRFSEVLLRPRPSARHFRIGVMGTSVTAGHDNWFNESYPMVAHGLLEPVLAAGGVRLTTRNFAMGGNKYETSVYCVEATVGGDVDVVVWEFNMIYHGPPEGFEAFCRNAMLLPSRPVFAHNLGFWQADAELPKRPDPGGTLVGGKQLTIDVPGRTIRAMYRGHKPGQHKFFDWYENVPFDNLTKTPKQRSGSYSLRRKPSYWAGKSGGSILEHYGAHWFDGEGSLFAVGHKAPYWGVALNQHKAAPTGSAPWHPGPAAHHFRGTIIAHEYCAVLLEAVDAIRKLLPSHGHGSADEAMASMHLSALEQARQKPLPPPITGGCARGSCGATPPKCATTMAPQTGPGLESHVTEGRVVDGRTKKTKAPAEAWVLTSPPWAANVISQVVESHSGYLDRKWALSGTSVSGWLGLTINATSPDAPIALCEVHCDWGKCPEGRGSLADDVDLELNGAAVNLAASRVDKRLSLAAEGKNPPCVQIGTAKKPGPVSIRLRVREGKKGAKPVYVLLSHVIWW